MLVAPYNQSGTKRRRISSNSSTEGGGRAKRIAVSAVITVRQRVKGDDARQAMSRVKGDSACRASSCRPAALRKAYFGTPIVRSAPVSIHLCEPLPLPGTSTIQLYHP